MSQLSLTSEGIPVPASPLPDSRVRSGIALNLRKPRPRHASSIPRKSETTAFRPSLSSPGTTTPSHRQASTFALDDHDEPHEDHNMAILQEVDNGSQRRKRIKAAKGNDTGKAQHILWSTDAEHLHYGFSSPLDDSPKTPSFHATSSPQQSPSSRTSSAKLFKTSIPQRSTSTSRTAPNYVEHLESQLAAMRIQLQALTSPSTTRAQSAKLRAMHAETTTLRAEVVQWEKKFNDRLREQGDEHTAIIDSLRSQLHVLETDVEAKTVRINELESESEQRAQSLDAVEEANENLERRLAFMSELLATSPTRIALHSENSGLVTKRRNSRPLSLDPTTMLSYASALPFQRPSIRSQRETSPLSPTPRERFRTWEDDDRAQPHKDNSAQPSSGASSPSRPNSRGPAQHSPERSVGGKGGRRMRRFYTGSGGVRSLILPATTHAGPYPTSAPIREPPRFSPDELHSSEDPLDRMGRESRDTLTLQNSSKSSPHLNSARRRSSSWSMNRTSPKRLSIPLSPTLPVCFKFPVQEASSVSGAKTGSVHHHATKRSWSVDQVSPAPSTSSATMDCANSTASHNHDADEASSLTSIDEVFKLNDRQADDDESDELSDSDDIELDLPSRHGSFSLPLPSRRHNALPTPSVRTHHTLPPGTPTSNLSLAPIARLAATLKSSVHTCAIRARLLFVNAWSLGTLSRPALEFRWWLIGILLRPILKQQQLQRQKLLNVPPDGGGSESLSSVLKPPYAVGPAALSTWAGGTDLGSRPGLRDNQRYFGLQLQSLKHAVHARNLERSRRADAPPSTRNPLTIPGTTALANWVTFSMTLLLAVGIALKDGPASLFREPTRQPPDASGTTPPLEASRLELLEMLLDSDDAAETSTEADTETEAETASQAGSALSSLGWDPHDRDAALGIRP